MNLRDKIFIITGASQGIGRCIAEGLVRRRAEVYGLSRNIEKLKKVQADLGPAFHYVACDVRDREAVQVAVDKVLEREGRIDGLINNAGLGRFGPVDDVSTADWQVQMDTNLTGAFHCTQAVVPTMKAQNAASGFGGHIINIASIAAIIGNANLSVYNATKFGLRGFSEALMKELRTDGIKVTCVCPGSVATDFRFQAGAPSPSTNKMMPEDVAETVLHVLQGPDNYLISEVVMRPLRPKG